MSDTKTKAKVPAKKCGSNDLEVTAQSKEDEAMTRARNVIAPTVRGAVTTEAFSAVFGEFDLISLIEALAEQNGKVRDGSLSRAESLLMTQAQTLDAIFNELARRAGGNMGEYMNAMDRYLRLALKAQSQCRATLETLATIKNPPVIYARQANIANGFGWNQCPACAGIRKRAAASELRQDARSRRRGKLNRAKQTFGATTWATAGHRNAGRGNRR